MKNVHTMNDSQSALGAKVLYIFNTQWKSRSIRKVLVVHKSKHNDHAHNRHDHLEAGITERDTMQKQ